MAFEEAGLGTWERCGFDVPLVAGKERIMVPDEWDEWHPRIGGKTVVVTQGLCVEKEKEAKEKEDQIGVEIEEVLSEVPTAVAVSPTSTSGRSEMEISPVSQEGPSSPASSEKTL